MLIRENIVFVYRRWYIRILRNLNKIWTPTSLPKSTAKKTDDYTIYNIPNVKWTSTLSVNIHFLSSVIYKTILWNRRMSNTRYFINIIDIANLANIQSTLCEYQIIICSVPPTSSTLQCRSTSSRHSVCLIHMHPLYSVYIVDIVNIAMWTKVESTLCLYWASFFLVYIVDIINIAVLINIVSTSCLHCTLFILFHTRVFLHCTHSNEEGHQVDIVSTLYLLYSILYMTQNWFNDLYNKDNHSL